MWPRALLGTEGNEILLAMFMGAIALVYLDETVYHALFGDTEANAA